MTRASSSRMAILCWWLTHPDDMAIFRPNRNELDKGLSYDDENRVITRPRSC